MTTNIGKHWHEMRSETAASIEVTQYGIRLPNGRVYWGDVTASGQPATVPHGNTPYSVFADPKHVMHDDARSMEGVRQRVRASLRTALLPEEAIEQHVANVVRVERLVVVTFSGTREVQ